MIEFKNHHVEQPKHFLDAEIFIDNVRDIVIPLYQELQIDVFNQTADDSNSYSPLQEEYRLRGNRKTIAFLGRTYEQAAANSILETQVAVNITGDAEERINHATDVINRWAAKTSRVKKIFDSGIGHLGGQALFVRYLRYKFF